MNFIQKSVYNVENHHQILDADKLNYYDTVFKNTMFTQVILELFNPYPHPSLVFYVVANYCGHNKDIIKIILELGWAVEGHKAYYYYFIIFLFINCQNRNHLMVY